MARYKNGIETKQKIYKKAKALFYQHGYDKTSITMIAKELGIPKGLVSYYYKKDELMMDMHEELILSIFNCIEEQVGGELGNSLQWHLILLQLLYMAIYSDEKKLALYNCMLHQGMVSARTNEIVERRIMEEINDFNLDVEPEEFQIFITAQYGAHKEITKDYLQSFDPQKSQQLFFYSGTVALRMAGADRKLLDESTKKVESLLSKIDVSGIASLT